ncbi:MAG: copper chaperone PCu(A)C [Anaerolineae bacterium]|nr:copper chaperone PCu(A)C [Anaerolineae bacterium]
MRRHLAPLILLASIVVLSACSNANAPAIQVTEAWARAPGSAQAGEPAATPTAESMAHGMARPTGAAYMRIRNTTSAPDQLLLAQSDVAQSTEIHTVEVKNGVMAMRPVDRIEIPAKGEVVLKPGGFHVMLIGLTKDLKPGDRFSLTLHFEKTGNIEIQVEVRQP